MPIQTYTLDTALGKSHTKLEFLTDGQMEELNTIGYTGHNSFGRETSREIYLNSLGIGVFKIVKTKSDTGDFCESFMIIRYVEETKK